LIDDEEAILIPAANYFRSLGCRVDVAREPEEAAALLTYKRYHVVILDLRLSPYGGAQGLSVLRELRERDRFACAIVLSGYISQDVEDEAREGGADVVLPKPQSLPELARVAFNLLERTSA
jgi:CheY-like chemotaxis protein